ncbi:MAG: nuclear transport factor 2 family protein [Flavobacteriaceae bacterium]|jgi:hypothetical protein|nr:nuclear transport factor 2 family protein [Flavobacteriaceae bacterium]MDG1911714.1 nuclear transport factor 2 family protein [Flavobacteriaceae bacterium]
MKKLWIIWGLIFSIQLIAQQKVQPSDSLAIVSTLFKQQEDWNKGDIDAFMEGYLKSDQLVFSGSSGPIYGWNATKERYKKNYSSRLLMGSLTFDVLNLISLSPTVAQLQGKFYLTREIADSSGFFTLTWVKIEDQWLIISDHTSASE